MFGFGRKKDNSSRKVLIKEFESIITGLEKADEDVQSLVGHGINIAFGSFKAAYGDAESFNNISNKKQLEYIHKLAEMESICQQDENESQSSIGVKLFRMWIAALAENDEELMTRVGSEMEKYSLISRKREFGY